MKATYCLEVKKFQDIPNVGPRIEHDFIMLGIKTPQSLTSKDPYKLYRKLEKVTNSKQDPCVLDTFMAVVDFMNGAPPHPWFHYTKERKRQYQNL